VTDARTLLAHNVKMLRKLFGISQMTLAEMVGCSTTLIGNIEIKKRFPSAENINRIAGAFQVRVMDLFAEADPANEGLKIESGEQLKQLFQVRMEKALTDVMRSVVTTDTNGVSKYLASSFNINLTVSLSPEAAAPKNKNLPRRKKS
jgi:transcriptional regulator with XRE-family HTH domain